MAVGPKSLYEVIHQIDNQKDYHDYILSHEGNPGAVAKEQIKYECHPVSYLRSASHHPVLTFPLDARFVIRRCFIWGCRSGFSSQHTK